MHGQGLPDTVRISPNVPGVSEGRPEWVMQGNALQAASFLCPVAHVSEINKAGGGDASRSSAASTRRITVQRPHR